MENSHIYIDTYEFCNEILSQYKEGVKKGVSDNFQLINEFASKYDGLKQKLPYHINVIDELHINENANSRILASLLLYNINGDYPLLKSFIEYCIGDWGIKVDKPHITTERMRIDLLVREEGKYAIIFENKIYEAILQKNQIARYIQKIRLEGYKDEQIFVVFLPPYEYDPDICSWQEEKECCKTCDRSKCQINSTPELKEQFKNRFKIVTFSNDVISWLKKEVIPNYMENEVYLHTAVVQYLDYLEGYFDLRTINKEMNMELQQFLIEKLKLNEKEPKERLEVLDRKTEEINNLLKHIDIIKKSISKEIDFDVWQPYLSRIEEDIKKLKISNLKCECGYVDEASSHFYLRFYKDGWQLSIVVEKYACPEHYDGEIFIYIGKPGEENVDGKYLEDRKQVFRESNYTKNHPYGWEWIEKYNKKPEVLKTAIEDGTFITYLETKIEHVLKKIEKENLKMD